MLPRSVPLIVGRRRAAQLTVSAGVLCVLLWGRAHRSRRGRSALLHALSRVRASPDPVARSMAQ